MDVFCVKREMHRLVTCLIHLLKILYLHLQVSESSTVSIQAVDGSISHICCFHLVWLTSSS